MVFFEVTQHWDTDTLKQLVGEDIAGDAPEMSHQEDSECGIGARGCGRSDDGRGRWRGKSFSFLLGTWGDLFVD